MRTDCSLRSLRSLALTALSLALPACAPAAPMVQWASSACAMGEAVAGPEGFRRLALVVGIGQYGAPSVPDLAGPPNDARRFVELLTGPSGYGFPKQNVCLLLDEEGTRRCPAKG